MDTKLAIKLKALELFNTKGVLNVTLRDVAKELNKSYGNITYHYHTKEQVLDELYFDMSKELTAISTKLMTEGNLFENVVKAPSQTFDLSVKYLFFFVDFKEIKRNFPALGKVIDKNNALRKKALKQSLIYLQQQQILRADLDKESLDYLMELSGAMRTFFFINLDKDDLKKKDLKARYVVYTNKLLLPYLTAKGKSDYDSIEK